MLMGLFQWHLRLWVWDGRGLKEFEKASRRLSHESRECVVSEWREGCCRGSGLASPDPFWVWTSDLIVWVACMLGLSWKMEEDNLTAEIIVIGEPQACCQKGGGGGGRKEEGREIGKEGREGVRREERRHWSKVWVKGGQCKEQVQTEGAIESKAGCKN